MASAAGIVIAGIAIGGLLGRRRRRRKVVTPRSAVVGRAEPVAGPVIMPMPVHELSDERLAKAVGLSLQQALPAWIDVLVDTISKRMGHGQECPEVEVELPISVGVPVSGTIFISHGESVFDISNMLTQQCLHDVNAESVIGTPKAREIAAQCCELITMSPWNDSIYGRRSGELSPDDRRASSFGRGIVCKPVHHDNVARLKEGMPPMRADAPSGHYPQVWIPLFNLDILERDLLLSTDGVSWETGDSSIMPPPVVSSLGVLNAEPGRWGS